VYSQLDCKTRGHITEGIMAEMEGHARGSRRGPPPGLRGRGDPGSRAIGWVAAGRKLAGLHRDVGGSRGYGWIAGSRALRSRSHSLQEDSPAGRLEV
jgi:hypothetical protein